MKKLHVKPFIIVLIDLTIVLFSYMLASYIIHDFSLFQGDWLTVWDKMYIILPVYLLSFYIFKLDKSLWRYASVDEAVKVVLSVIFVYVILAISNYFFNMNLQYNTLIIAQVFTFISIAGVRFSYRMIRLIRAFLNRDETKSRTLIIGAGHAANLLINEIRNNPKMNNKVVCLVDDDLKKINKFVQGYKVAGTLNDLPNLVKLYKIDEIIVAIPSAQKSDIQIILKYCEPLKIKIKILPPFYEMIDKTFSIDKIRDVQIEDLLGRDAIVIDPQGLYDFILDEVVLVTGGGGSIGSELCRQIVNFNPKQLIIVDIYENNAYDIQNELGRHLINNTEIITLIASIRDKPRMEEIFETYHPTIVFHAAAHKHVPLMEASPTEAIKNNIFGTHNIVKLSDKYKVKKFVLISTDKAVNPTNIMGSTKRFAEMIIQAYDQHSETQYAAVRFGNVLGSNGSVIPLFKKQIEEGGPVTVTHRDIIRYFMTIPEAVQLVLQAGAFARGGEIFVLDMGDPVKIIDLAEQLIRLSGYEPYREIEIQITGLRPGEKLYEELLMDTEGLTKTDNSKIFILTQVNEKLEEILHNLEKLDKLINRKHVNIQEEFHSFVKTYTKTSNCEEKIS